MLEIYVSRQTAKLYTPVIAADSLHYLTGRVYFAGEDWDGFSKWVHFRQGEGPGATVYDIALDENDEIPAERQLNLTLGEWLLYLTGTKGEVRLTTVPLALTVKESGLIDAPLHPMPLSVAEQIDSKAAAALACAGAVKSAADAGAFNGRDGQSFVIGGYFDTFAELLAQVPEPRTGQAYGVGLTAPYDIYIWDAVHGAWKNNGALQGLPGQKGENGVTFLPLLDDGGNLSWTNDGGLENPATRNIRGPAGADGQTGPAGPAAYASAAAAGYTGTEATFYAALAAIPYHNARHLPEGADPITVKTGNLENSAVTRQKIADHAVTQLYTATVGTNWAPSVGTRFQLISPDGTAVSYPIEEAPSALTSVRKTATDEELTEGTDYSYAAGVLTFTVAPAAGTNSYRAAWSVETAPYTQTVTVEGLEETDAILMDAVPPLDPGEAEDVLEAYALIYRAAPGADTLTLYASGLPGRAIPIQLLAVRK